MNKNLTILFFWSMIYHIFKEILMKILDFDKNIFKRIFYGKYYLVEYLENDPELQMNHSEMFQESIYIPEYDLLLIGMGEQLFYKMSENEYLGIFSYDKVSSKKIEDQHYYLRKEDLIPFEEFYQKKLDPKKKDTLADLYPKRKVKKLLEHYFIDRNKD